MAADALATAKCNNVASTCHLHYGSKPDNKKKTRALLWKGNFRTPQELEVKLDIGATTAPLCKMRNAH